MHKIVLNHITSTVLSGALTGDPDSKSNFVNPYVTEPQCLYQFLLLRESKRNKKASQDPN